MADELPAQAGVVGGLHADRFWLQGLIRLLRPLIVAAGDRLPWPDEADPPFSSRIEANDYHRVRREVDDEIKEMLFALEREINADRHPLLHPSTGATRRLLQETFHDPHIRSGLELLVAAHDAILTRSGLRWMSAITAEEWAAARTIHGGSFRFVLAARHPELTDDFKSLHIDDRDLNRLKTATALICHGLRVIGRSPEDARPRIAERAAKPCDLPVPAEPVLNLAGPITGSHEELATEAEKRVRPAKPRYLIELDGVGEFPVTSKRAAIAYSELVRLDGDTAPYHSLIARRRPEGETELQLKQALRRHGDTIRKRMCKLPQSVKDTFDRTQGYDGGCTLRPEWRGRVRVRPHSEPDRSRETSASASG